MNLFTHSSTVAFIASKISPVIAEPPAYPFVGQNAVRAAIDADPELQRAVVALMWHLQTTQERDTRDTISKNRAGFMSSDAKVGTAIAEILASEGVLTPAQHEWCSRASKYAKQVTCQLRLVAMTADPKLAAYAQTFSIRA